MTDPTAPVTPRTKAGHEHSFVLQQGATCRCGVTRTESPDARTRLVSWIRTLSDNPAYEEGLLRDLRTVEREAGSTDALRAALADIMSIAVDHLDNGRLRLIHKIAQRAALSASDAGPAESMPVTLVGMALHAIKQRDRLHETPCRCEADAFDLRQWHESEALPDDRHSVMGLSRESDR
jgi:hypothetical protein